MTPARREDLAIEAAANLFLIDLELTHEQIEAVSKDLPSFCARIAYERRQAELSEGEAA